MEIAKKLKKFKKGTPKRESDEFSDVDIEMALLGDHEEEEKEEEKEDKKPIPEKNKAKKCVDAPNDKTSCVIGIRMNVTEFTNNANAHRRTIQYLKIVLKNTYKSEIAYLTSNTNSRCVTACLYVQKTTAIPLENAIKDNTLLGLMNDAYLMHIKYPTARVNPRNPDSVIRIAKVIRNNPKLACFLGCTGSYQEAYESLTLTHITCPENLAYFDGDNQLRDIIFPPVSSAEVTSDSKKENANVSKKKGNKLKSAGDTKNEIVAFLSTHNDNPTKPDDVIQF